jgi:urea transporter
MNSPIMPLQREDFMSLSVAAITKNIEWNSLHAIGYYFAGSVVAVVIDALSRNIVQFKTGSSISDTITFTTCLAGMALPTYFVQRAKLINFTARETLMLLILDATAMYFVTKKIYPLPLVTMGILMGRFGTHGLVALETFGSTTKQPLPSPKRFRSFTPEKRDLPTIIEEPDVKISFPSRVRSLSDLNKLDGVRF